MKKITSKWHEGALSCVSSSFEVFKDALLEHVTLGENGNMKEPKLPNEIHGYTMALRTDNTAVGKLIRKVVLF